ncbi:cell division protein FtsZ [Duncaniella sp.]|uniref:cell division protein FtsZ n=1 Tax=Duncaniella sp. TaxID=2518496 RepID=UPI00261E6028|nr:cell division protein FtsZ [Duncaniella sp.]
MAIGVGGGGNNAVNHMYVQGIKNVSFVNINTDHQTLCHSRVPHTLEIGDGLGAGNKPEKARDFAEESADEIAALFDDQTKMVFITAGMGGGTGTGAAPVVARIAKERGLLTIGIVTIPFLFEGQKKIRKAIAGADEMAKHVDALLVINNERLGEIYGDLDFLNAFGKADDTLSIAARSISELITCNGLINLDFNDVDTTLRDGGAAIISTGFGEGENRVTKAIHDALNSPLLKNRDILGSKKLLFNLFFNPNAEEKFLMSETREITDFIGSINTDVDVIWGVGFDENLGNGVKMTILAAGFDVTLREEEEEIMSGGASSGFGFSMGTPGSRPSTPVGTERQAAPAAVPPAPKAPAKPKEPEVSDERLAEEYGLTKIKDLTEGKDRSSTIVLGLNQLDDDAVCDILEKYPTYKRDRKIVDDVRNGALDGSANLSATHSAPGSTPQTFSFG